MREFIQVVRKQKADMGVFVCFDEQVTKPMQLAAKEEGYYRKDHWGDKFDKMQILTVEQLLDGESIKFPLTQTTTVKTAEKKIETLDHPELF